MSEVIKIRKGLDINLSGEALREIRRLPFSESYGICPSDFEGLTPKLLVCEGEAVKAGTPLFFDKKRPQVLITSPVSGRVEAIRRGEKRRVLEVVVAADGEQKYEDFGKHKPETATRKA